MAGKSTGTIFSEWSSTTWVAVMLHFLCLYCSVSEAAIHQGRNFAVQLLSVDTPTDATISMMFIFIAYTLQYLISAGCFEMINPKGFRSTLISDKERARRLRQVKAELRLGIQSMFIVVALTAVHMFYTEQFVWTYGYFEHNSYNWMWFLGSAIAYTFWFDTWFYWSHRWLHDFDFLWNNIHYVHHRFKEPTAFAQFAVHPLEAAAQGPVGHYMATLFFPFHPAALALFGFVGSIYAVAAHDGRQWDYNSHYYHHVKGRGRFIYFNLSYITPFWDILCGTRWHENHPNWVLWKTKGNKEIFDTQDGTSSGRQNDYYGALVGKEDSTKTQ